MPRTRRSGGIPAPLNAVTAAITGQLLRVGRIEIQIRVMARHAIDFLHPEVVRHQIHVVERSPGTIEAALRERIRKCARRARQQQGASSRSSFSVERLAECLRQFDEVFSVLWTMGVVVALEPRILPVDVETVQIVAVHERDRAGHERPAARLRQRGL